MESFIQLLVSGIAMGLIYCLVAIEYTLIFNTSGLMNFGHDKYITLGAYLFAGTFVLGLGLNTFVSILGMIVSMTCVGVFIALVVFNPLRNMPRLYAMTGTLALSYMIREMTRMIYGAMPISIPNFISGTMRIGFVALPIVYIWIIVVAVVLLLLQFYILNNTKIGKALRAVSQDKETCSLMGVNVRTMLVVSASMSLIISAIVGVLMIPLVSAQLHMSTVIGTKGFVAGVVGGIGNISGTIVGGLIVGLSENLFIALGGQTVYKDVVSFVLILIFLMLKPQGLLSKKGETLS